MTGVFNVWGAIGLVIEILAPLVLFAFAFSLFVYLFFVWLVPSLFERVAPGRAATRPISTGGAAPISGSNGPTAADGAAEAATDGAVSTAGDFGYLEGPGYVVMASLFGMVLGALVKLAGGFSALTSAPASSSGGGLLGPIAALLVVVIGVGGSLFVDSSRIGLRRPIGAICFLTSFLVSGLYWQYLPVG